MTNGMPTLGFEIEEIHTPIIIEPTFLDSSILAEMEQGNFRHLIFSGLSQDQIAEVLLKSPNTKIDIKAYIIGNLPAEDIVKKIVQIGIFDRKLKNILFDIDSIELFGILSKLASSADFKKEMWEKFVDQYKDALSETLIKSLESCSHHTGFSIIIDTIYNESIKNNAMIHFLKISFAENISKYIKSYFYNNGKNIETLKDTISHILSIPDLISSENHIFLEKLGDKKEIERIQNYLGKVTDKDFFIDLCAIFDHEIIDDTQKKLLSRYIQYGSHNTGVVYAYIKKHNSALLNKPEVQSYILGIYNPEFEIRGDEETSKEEVEDFLFSHIHILPSEKLIKLLTYRTKRDLKKIIKLADKLSHLEGNERITLGESILGYVIETDIQNHEIEQKIITKIQGSLLKEIYERKDFVGKAHIAHFSRKGFSEFSFIEKNDKESSGVRCFFGSKQTLEDFQKFMNSDTLRLCTSEQLLSLISKPEVLESSKYQETLNNLRHSENPFKKKIDKETQISLIKNNYRNIKFFRQLFDISYQETLEIYEGLPTDTDQKIRRIVFDAIHFPANEGLAFIKNYPDGGFANPKQINWDGSEHYLVRYSSDYRKLAEKYYTTEDIKNKIDTEIFSKLAGKVLVDLGSGGVASTVAPALQANASAYIGIDVHRAEGTYDEQGRNFVIQQYKLDESCKNHSTIVKSVFDKFENFLERVPTGAGYNFTINGLCLTKSMSSMKEHINRIMKPGNIILANDTENINIEDILTGPFKYTEIHLGIGFDNNRIHMYEKLAREKIVVL